MFDCLPLKEFRNGGSNSVNMLRVSYEYGAGFIISAGSINITDVLVVNADLSSGAITLSGTADAIINNVTLYGNDGAGLYNNSSGSVSIVNSIIWGNTTEIWGNNIWNTLFSTP